MSINQKETGATKKTYQIRAHRIDTARKRAMTPRTLTRGTTVG